MVNGKSFGIHPTTSICHDCGNPLFAPTSAPYYNLRPTFTSNSMFAMDRFVSTCLLFAGFAATQTIAFTPPPGELVLSDFGGSVLLDAPKKVIASSNHPDVLRPDKIVATQGGGDRTMSRPSLGAIRWDAWTGSSNSVGVQIERTLSPERFRFRIPFFGIETNNHMVAIDGTSQAIMDQEIEYAAHAGLDYWAFLWYASNSGLDQARNLYYTSSKKPLIDYCLIIEHNRFISEISIDSIVREFSNPSYFRVMGNRPLLYFFNHSLLRRADIDSLRARSIAAGQGNPYLVLFRHDANLSVIDSLNLDAFSMYAVTWMTGGVPYTNLTAVERGQWEWVAGASSSNRKKFVPHVTTGWDDRPRFYNPVSWLTVPTNNSFVTMPTPAEISDHIEDAIEFVNNNPATCEANTVIIYAWNEHDEGGWLSPTLSRFEGTARIDTMHGRFNNTATAVNETPILHQWSTIHVSRGEIQISNKSPQATLQIYSLQGRQIFSKQINQGFTVISTQEAKVSHGVYVMKLNDSHHKPIIRTTLIQLQ